MLRNMPLALLIILVAASLFSDQLPVFLLSNLYALSLTIKSFIAFALPAVIFGLLFKSAVHFANKASKLIFFVIGGVCLSNFFSTWVSFGVGQIAYELDLAIQFPESGSLLLPAWSFELPKLISNSYAMLSGLVLGAFFARFNSKLANTLSSKLEIAVSLILKAILILIPPFVAGFAVKMSYDQVMGHIFKHYSLIFALVTAAVFSYIGLVYFVLNRFSISNTLSSLKNMFSAAAVGFGSMSSAAAMPLSILGAEKNVKDPDIARSVIPATVNIHLVGDCFAIPIFAFAVMKSFGVEDPSFWNYLIFASYFVLAKFSVAAVPGGGILVMLPILEAYLGFNAEMLSLITALYILFDPVITVANIFGNGAFAIAIDKTTSLPKEIKQQEEPLISA